MREKVMTRRYGKGEMCKKSAAIYKDSIRFVSYN